jgi:hypothetical protein
MSGETRRNRNRVELNGKASGADCCRTNTLTLEDVESAGVLLGVHASSGFFPRRLHQPFRSIAKTVHAGSVRSQVR